MSYEIIPTDEFIKKDILKLSEELQQNPKKGIHLGNNVYKIRLKNTDNNKGKSKGYRVIVYIIDENFEIYLITIYSKNQKENILDVELKEIIKTVNINK